MCCSLKGSNEEVAMEFITGGCRDAEVCLAWGRKAVRARGTMTRLGLKVGTGGFIGKVGRK